MALAALAARPRAEFEIAAPPSSRAGALRFAAARGHAAFHALEGEWNALAERCGDARMGFQSFAWTRSWVDRYAEPGVEPCIVLGYHEDRLALIWPLVARRSLGLTILEYLGEPMAQYHEVIVAADAPGERLAAAAARYLRELNFDLLRLRRVREDSKLTPALLAAGAKISRFERAPFVELKTQSDDFDARLPAKARGNRRRRLRQLQQMGALTREVAGSPEIAADWIATALEFKRAWALKMGHRAPSVFDPRFELGFRDAALGPDPRASLRVFALKLDGRPIGVDISFVYRDRLFAHVLAPDPDFAKFGLGAALADASIRCAREQGYAIFDLLAPSDPYKSNWAHGDVGVNDLWLAGSRRGAGLGFAMASVNHALRAAAKKAPRALVRALMQRAERRRLDSEKGPR